MRVPSSDIERRKRRRRRRIQVIVIYTAIAVGLAWFFELQENIYYNFCTFREDEMYVIGRKCYNKYLAPKHNWVYKKLCNWAMKLLINRKDYTESLRAE